ncbi:hypothetical protein C882_2937 [Caenispirillum salinarum AK4]|uniref:Uncharacterized protein n=1 Tax=Caenispirillum salinarum AK4 TaxID=1238182 RepID=K9GJF8_9PROT|nr:hypothetical protein C882_2937 [Caenispirillum salinarum AK4]
MKADQPGPAPPSFHPAPVPVSRPRLTGAGMGERPAARRRKARLRRRGFRPGAEAASEPGGCA